MAAVRSDYDKVIVNKPWGYEYLMYATDDIGIWCLNIDQGQRTSLHCHPLKKTGLVLLSGTAEVSFLNDATPLTAPGRLMLRAGLFHSTKATSPEGAIVIEVETPRHKTNLVRLEDAYGREASGYEGKDKQIPKTGDCLYLDAPELGKTHTYTLRESTLSVEKTDDVAAYAETLTDEIILVLEGGLFSDDGQPVLAAGDVVEPATLQRLVKSFCAPEGMAVLKVRKTKE
jgi:mannose-6-phosphate isomerase-like protein (cupin superfamily)